MSDKLHLVTGGTGFLGEPLIERIIALGGRVRTIARNEGKLIMLKQKFPSIEIITGDISDPFYARLAMDGITGGVFHLAAFKHVGLAEKQPLACTKNNVYGSINILEESLRVKPDFVIGISTDKAAQVAGVYGASKLLMERLFNEYSQLNSETKYRLVRYGNVLYSTGSVLCKWKELLSEGKDVVVTDPNATRFFWTVDQALDLIYDCLDNATDCTPYVPEMKSMRIEDLLTAMHLKYGTSHLKITKIGLQPGENLHEKILEDGPYSNEVEQYSIDEIKKFI